MALPSCVALLSAGVSNVMAAHTISTNRGEYAPDGSYAEEAEQGGAQPKRLLYSYFTAGKHCQLCFEESLCVC
jgi:hypothetical protein